MKHAINNDMKVFLKKLLITIFSVLSLVIAPVITLVSLLGFNLPSLYNLTQFYAFILFLGAIIVILTLILFKLNNISKTWLAVSLIKELLYCIIILLWAFTGKIAIKIEDFEIFYDTSALILLFIGVPILFVIKIFLNFFERRKIVRLQLTILKVVKENNKLNTIWQIKKDLTEKSIEINNLSETIDLFINYDPPLMRRRGNLSLTKNGVNYLELYEKKYFKNINVFEEKLQTIPLQVWTEDDLKRRNR